MLILYTSGYRLNDKFSLVKTGGIYISAPFSGAEIYVNNKLAKTTNIIQRDFFESNLTPGTYFVFVYKKGYSPWSKEMEVYEQVVADANSFLVPQEPNLTELPKTTPGEAGGSPVSNQDYKNALNLFSAKLPIGAPLNTLSAAATSTVLRDKTKLILSGNSIYSEWEGEPNRAPSYFLDAYKRVFTKKVPVFTSTTKIKTFDFYPSRNDVILIARKNGIYAVEADRRKVQNFSLVYAGNDADFRIGSDGKVYIKDADSIYIIEL